MNNQMLKIYDITEDVGKLPDVNLDSIIEETKKNINNNTLIKEIITKDLINHINFYDLGSTAVLYFLENMQELRKTNNYICYLELYLISKELNYFNRFKSRILTLPVNWSFKQKFQEDQLIYFSKLSSHLNKLIKELNEINHIGTILLVLKLWIFIKNKTKVIALVRNNYKFNENQLNPYLLRTYLLEQSENRNDIEFNWVNDEYFNNIINSNTNYAEFKKLTNGDHYDIQGYIYSKVFIFDAFVIRLKDSKDDLFKFLNKFEADFYSFKKKNINFFAPFPFNFDFPLYAYLVEELASIFLYNYWNSSYSVDLTEIEFSVNSFINENLRIHTFSQLFAGILPKNYSNDDLPISTPLALYQYKLGCKTESQS